MSDPEQNQISQVGNHIKITVKVDELFNAPYPPINDDAIVAYTQLRSGANVADYGAAKDTFSVNVQVNGVIHWDLDFDDNTQRRDYMLELICIAEKKTSSTAFFDFDPLLPTRNMIIATPKNGEYDNIYKYNIIFSITDDFGNLQTYVIDPQLRMT